MSSPFFTAFRRDRRSVHLSFACLLLLALASATWAASAPDPAGRVIRTLGLVEAIAPDGSVRRLRRQDPIFEGDTLRTGARGRAQIRFTDRGLMSLRPATELAIDDYEYDAGAPSSARQQLRLARGGFRAATGRVAAGNRAGYRVTTPLAVIGVRGTLWSAAQADGGPLALGVEEGGIEATTSTGRTATLGMDSGYDFARINVDGSIDYLVEPPAELASGSGIEAADDDEGGDGGGGSAGGGGSGAGGDAGTGGGSDVGGPVVPGAGLSVADSDGGDAGDEEGDDQGGEQSAGEGSGQSMDDGAGQGTRQVAVQRTGEVAGESAGEGGDFGSSEDAGQAPAPAELGTAAASTALVTTTNSPENTGAIAQSESGTGSLPTEEPIPGIDSDDIDARLQPAELEALADGFFFVGAFGTSEAGVAGGRAVDARTNGGATILTFNGVETPDGIEPVIPGDAGFLTLPPAFVLRNGGGVTDFVGTVGIPGGDSLAAVSWLADGGQTGSGSGSFGSGIDAFDAADGSPLGISFETAHFITGQPTAIADLTGSFDYSEASLLTSDFFANIAASSVPLTAVDFFFSVDFGTGLVSNGLLDLFTDGTQPVVSLVFDGRIVGEAGVNAADLNILDGIFGAQGSVDLERSELGGFFAGATGEAFAGVFSLFEAGGPGAALGTLAAQQAQPAPGAPGRPLTAAEQTRLEAGFGYAQATVNAGVARTFKGRITDPRDGDAAALVIANGGRTVLDPIFNDVPPNQVILRPDDALLQFLTVPTDDLGAELAFFEVQGFPDAPGLPGGPIGIYDSVTGERTAQIADELLLLTGRIAEIADLTGRGRFSLQSVVQGYGQNDSGDFFSFVEPGLQDDATLAFSVDFGSGAIGDGIGQLFTDVEQIGSTDPFLRDRVEFFFNGTVGLQNGNVFADMAVLGGIVLDEDGDTGGSGSLDPAASSLAGFFAGDGDVFNAAFALTSVADADSPPDFSPTAFLGNAILTRQDLRPTAAELAEFDLGFVFVAAECCGPESSTSAGIAGDVTRFGTVPGIADVEVIFGINTDPQGEELGVLDPGFLDNSPEVIGRPLDALVVSNPTFPVATAADLVEVTWIARPFSSGAVIGTASGNINDTLDRTTLFLAAQPTPVSVLAGEGFQTFSGSNADVLQPGLGGSFATNAQDDGVLPPGVLDPDDVFLDAQFFGVPQADVSFNVDFSSGVTGFVSNGVISAGVVGNSTAGTEVGLRLFFDGVVDLSTGANPFVATNILGGSIGGIPLNMDETDIELFFIGAGAPVDSFITAVGSYAGVTMPTAEFPVPIAVAGTFTIGAGALFEDRLNVLTDLTTAADVVIDDAAAFNAGGLGIATFSDFSPFGGGEAPAGSNGFLIGRAGRLDAASGDPSDEIFTIAANAWEVPGRDPLTGAPLGEVRTERRGFFSQPFDFVLRRGSNPTDQVSRAAQSLFDDVTPNQGQAPSFAADGFDISWGFWQSSGSTDSAVIQQLDPGGLGSVETFLDRDLFFAEVNPTPTSQLPSVGQFTYTSLSAVGFGTDYIGSGLGPLTGDSQLGNGLDYVTAQFDLDFATGDINAGILETGYSTGPLQARWTASFDGFVEDALLDLEVNALDVVVVTAGTPGQPITGALDRSEIGGALTGPTGERAVLGFNFALEVVPGAPPVPPEFETVSGIAILDRAAPGTLRPATPAPPLP